MSFTKDIGTNWIGILITTLKRKRELRNCRSNLELIILSLQKSFNAWQPKAVNSFAFSQAPVCKPNQQIFACYSKSMATYILLQFGLWLYKKIYKYFAHATITLILCHVYYFNTHCDSYRYEIKEKSLTSLKWYPSEFYLYLQDKNTNFYIKATRTQAHNF